MGILRLYLAYVVLLSHCPEGTILNKISHPALAVQCFYAISGFYVQLLVYQFRGKGEGWALQFYKNRILRIFPTYLILLVITTILFPGSLIYLKSFTFQKMLTFLTANLILVTQGLMRYLAIPVNVLPQAWTLSLEFMFYIISPFLLLKNNRVLLSFIILGVILRVFDCFVLKLYLHDWFYGFFPQELPIFLLGSLGFRFYNTYLRNVQKQYVIPMMMVNVLIASYLAWFTFYGWLRINVGQWDGIATLGVPLRYWAVLFVTIGSLPFLFHLTKNSRLDRIIGEFSYPVYLSHFLFIELFQGYLNSNYLNLCVFISSMILSYVLVQLVEIPISNYRQSLKNRIDNGSNIVMKPA